MINEEKNYIMGCDPYKLTQLPEKWCIKITTENRNILKEWFNNNIAETTQAFTVGAYYGNAIKDDPSTIIVNCSNKIDGFEEIIFNDFQRFVLNKEKINDMKIIGYKAPYDLFEGKVKKGTVYVFKDTGYVTQDGGKGYLPKEIVEQWEAVYSDIYIKEGDWVVAKLPCDSSLEKVYQVIGVSEDNIEFGKSRASSVNLKGCSVTWIDAGYISRKATEEEIKAAQIQLPTINGYKGEYKDGFIVYGDSCANFQPAFFKNIYSLITHENKNNLNNGGNRTVATVRLNSKVEISLEQIEQICKFIDNIK